MMAGRVSTVLLLLVTLSFVVSSCYAVRIGISGESPAVGAPPLTPAQRAQTLLNNMTTQQMLNMVHGYPSSYVGCVNNNTNINIPVLNLQDGPQGVGDGATNVTAWPSALTVVATWNTASMYKYAQGMAAEQKGKGTNIMLGPMTNIARVPQDGRNFESFGEDPALASGMIVNSVQGIQSQGIMATAKHFVDNNQETNRTLVSENVPQRAQWEIYYPAFNAAVKAGVVAIMCSYNKINNTYACENNQTLNVDLKGRMNFTGFVMSDWGATHSTVQAANNGLDMEMPDSSYFGSALAQAVADGEVSQARLEDMVLRILTAMFTVGIFDIPQPTGNLSVNVMSDAHNELSRILAEQATVLLTNNGILPLSATTYSTIAIIGDQGSANVIVVGDGSGRVIPPYIVTPLQGITNYLQNVSSSTQVQYANSSSVSAAAALAQSADIAIVFVATDSSEGSDRPTLALDPTSNAIISNVSAVQPNTIVVVTAPGAVLMPWVDDVAAILCPFLSGQEFGNAIANVLFGAVNPSGRLPVTFPISDEQIPTNTTNQWPGIDNEANYTEGIFVGYRWYDHYNQTPLFPFGHGLSYTTFDYGELTISSDGYGNLEVSISIINNGTLDGAEVVQFYLGFPSSAGEPPKVLRSFANTYITTGDTVTIEFELAPEDFSIWDVTINDWSVISGEFSLFAGASSRDIRSTVTFSYP